MSEFMNGEWGWDTPIENDSEFQLLPEGDYNFRVVKFERGRHSGSDKLPPCNKAILTIELWNGSAKSTIEHNLFLHSKCEGLLCEFFTAIGQRRHGERLVPRWNEVIGATGTCKVSVREWTSSRDGRTMQSNDIKRFYEKGHAIESLSNTAPAAQPQAGYKAGSF